MSLGREISLTSLDHTLSWNGYCFFFWSTKDEQDNKKNKLKQLELLENIYIIGIHEKTNHIKCERSNGNN